MVFRTMVLDYPEKVKCNRCGKLVGPEEGEEWTTLYLKDCGDGSLVYPRCEECAKKEEADEQQTQQGQVSQN